jgi:2-polyprenyl-3-methyl-5-hydroxy-6-metoxy-1,4-benzoquinol methylase
VIRSAPCPRCFLCNTRGELLYRGLHDRLFNSPGDWNLRTCPSRDCGLLWLDPMPLETDIGKAYANYFTHESPGTVSAPLPSVWHRIAALVRSAYLANRYNYGRKPGTPLRWLLGLPILLSRIECDVLDIPIRYLAVPRKGRVLDVGCGNGSVLKTAQDLGWIAEGVDFDPQAVEAARRKGLSVRVGRLADQHYSEGSFDLVLMSHVIEHLHDPLATLSEINRVLNAGGTLVVTTPNADGLGHRHFASNWVHLDPPRHLSLFNGTNLCTLIRRGGFRSAQVHSSLRITPLTFVASRSIRTAERGYTSRWPTFVEELYGRAGSALQLLMRLWDPLAADELLLEAYK